MSKPIMHPWTEEYIRNYAEICGNKSAANLLLLLGPDLFVGTYDEYTALLDDLNNN